MKIGVVAPSVYLLPVHVQKIRALAAAQFPDVELVIHPQVFARSSNVMGGETGFTVSNEEVVPDPMRHGHFAGNDAQRRDAFIEFANREDIDAIWFARGGYGAGRIAPDILPRLSPIARRKTYMGYSDAGYLLAALYRAGFPHVAHGPMVVDVNRSGGEEPASRALAWLSRKDPRALEPTMRPGDTHVGFNLITLAMLVGTPLMPDLSNSVVMVEEVSEYLYSVDRCMFAVTSSMWRHPPKELRLGRISDVKDNDRPFGDDEVGIARYWCERANIRYGGRADIGHDNANKVVPFGRLG